jgi:hypothetical protein
MNVTRKGEGCVAWGEVTAGHSYLKADSFPDSTLMDASNRCRNPSMAPAGPWCFTDIEGTEWDYCNVTYCGNLLFYMSYRNI